MRKRYVGLALALALLLGLVAAYVAQGAQLYRSYHLAYANYRLLAGPCDALVTWSPPSVLYTALYVNQPRLLTLRYRSPIPQTLRITLSIPGLTQEQTKEVQAASAFQQLDFKPPLQPSALDSLISPGQRDGQIRLQVHGDGGDCTVTPPVTLKSPQLMHWYDPATATDYSPYLAGWVTPDAPAVQEFVGHATAQMEQHPELYPGTNGFNGYLGQPSADAVRGQVDALFDTLAGVYHVRYAEDNVPYAQDAIQRIQLPRDILASPAPTGMCVETTVTLASAVERLGMRPYIVIVPGHAFLGVALGPGDGAPIEYWETSLLNGQSGAQANTFGDQEYHDALAKVATTVVNVAYERSLGIHPIE
jgi:hypothetical protein